MIIKYNKEDFYDYSSNDIYNQLFLKAVIKWFYKLYEKYKVVSLTDFVRKLGYNKSLEKYYYNNILWVKGETDDPKIELKGYEINII